MLLQGQLVQLVVLCCVGYAGEFAIYYCKRLLPGSAYSHARLPLAGVKSRLRLTFSDSEHTVMHSSYTSRRGIENLLRMMNSP